MSSASDSGSESELQASDDELPEQSTRKNAAFTQPTSFDAYIVATTTPARTSNAVFSSLEALTPDEYARLVQRAQHPKSLDPAPFYPMYARTVDAGFNVFFYGYGSKLAALDAFARTMLSRRGPIVVSRCFAPSFAIRDFLGTLQRATSATAPTLEAVTTALDTLQRTLFLVMHSLDKAPPKVRSATLRLAALPGVCVCASLDHIRSPALFGQRDLAGWVWHDLTTLAPYNVELAHIDPLALRQQPAGAASTEGTSTRAAITETGAAHVLASVTVRAKRLFALIATRQLDGDDVPPGPEHGIEHDALLTAARTDFIASSDTALRALLGEFTDHGLILTENDMLWIPMRKDVLQRVLDKTKTE